MPVRSLYRRDASGMPDVGYWPGLSPAGLLVGTLGLVWLVPGTGLSPAIVLTVDNTPLVVASGPAPDVLGYLSVGQVRVYVPVSVPAILLVGELISGTGGRWARGTAVVFGLLAAPQLVILTGCGCGTGSVTPLGRAALAGL